MTLLDQPSLCCAMWIGQETVSGGRARAASRCDVVLRHICSGDFDSIQLPLGLVPTRKDFHQITCQFLCC